MRLLAIAVFLFLIGSTQTAFARCRAGSIWSYPASGDVLPQNGQIVLVASGNQQQSLVHAASDAWGLRHEASGEVVAVRAQRALKSSRSRSARVLRVVGDLEVGATYRLVRQPRATKGAKGRADITDFLIDGDMKEPTERTWVIGPGDRDVPTWNGALKHRGHVYKRYGCGPASYHHVNANAEGATLFLASLTGAGRTQRFFVAASDSPDEPLRIGHGMCGGEFAVDRKTVYELRLRPLDHAGNRGQARTLVLSPKKRLSRDD